MIVPMVSNVFNISCEVIEILQSFVQRSGSRDSRELIFLLQRPAFQVQFWVDYKNERPALTKIPISIQSLLLVHDTISQKDYVPKLPEPIFDNVDEDEETIKIVQLVKSNEPLVKKTVFLLKYFFSEHDV